MMGRKAVFGRTGRASGAATPIQRAHADDDGIARVFPRGLWDDARIGGFLRELGLQPDDPQNLLPQPDAYRRERYTRARATLDRRMAKMAAEFEAPADACQLVPFLLIDLPLWNGRFGALLCERLGLVAWDEWNVVIVAADEETRAATGLPLHPGVIPALNVRMTETLDAFARQLDADLAEACPPGLPIDGTARARTIAIESETRDRLLGFVAVCRTQIEALLAD